MITLRLAAIATAALLMLVGGPASGVVVALLAAVATSLVAPTRRAWRKVVR